MIKITNKIIEGFNPCEYGIENFNSLYPNYKDSLSNLLQLENISYSDKIWLVCKVVDRETLQQWSVECAEMVADDYNKLYPNDTRISDCIETTKRYLLGECSLDELTAVGTAAMNSSRSAWESAESVAWSVAWSAARAAVWPWSAARSVESAESAESVAWSAARAAVWSWESARSVESADSARAAAMSIKSAAMSAAKRQKDLSLSILIALLED